MDRVERWDRAAGRICSFFLWIGLGVLMLVFSWELFWRMGEVSLSEDRLPYQEDYLTGNSGAVEGEERGKEKKTEIFGIEIQIQNGKIVFFREKTRIE